MVLNDAEIRADGNVEFNKDVADVLFNLTRGK